MKCLEKVNPYRQEVDEGLPVSGLGKWLQMTMRDLIGVVMERFFNWIKVTIAQLCS
jgi:hypothetical protein